MRLVIFLAKGLASQDQRGFAGISGLVTYILYGLTRFIREGAQSGLWGDQITPNIMAWDDFGCMTVLAKLWVCRSWRGSGLRTGFFLVRSCGRVGRKF